MTQFLERLGEHVGAWLYVVAGGLAFGEAAILLGMVLPGETALLVAGYFCHEGVLSLPIMIAVAVVAAVGGDSVGYAMGQRLGRPLQASRLGQWIGDRRWEKTAAFLHRHGGKAVFLGRLTAMLRALVPGMAGIARMPYYQTFLPWNIAGGVLWGSGCVLLGYAFAASLHTVERYLTWGPVPVLALVVGVLVWREIASRRRERAAVPAGQVVPAEATGAEAAEAADRGPEPLQW